MHICAKFLTCLFIIRFGRFWYSNRCQFRYKLIRKGFKSIEGVQQFLCNTAYKNRIRQNVKKKKTVIAYKMKTVQIGVKDFILNKII